MVVILLCVYCVRLHSQLIKQHLLLQAIFATVFNKECRRSSSPHNPLTPPYLTTLASPLALATPLPDLKENHFPFFIHKILLLPKLTNAFLHIFYDQKVWPPLKKLILFEHKFTQLSHILKE